MNKNWEYYKLSDVCSIHGRIGWQGLTRKEHKTSGDYLLITGTDFTDDNKINLKTCVYVDEYRYTQDENIQIKKDDLLITKDGTLGKLALISEELPKPATLNGGIFVLRDKTKKLYPRFLLQYMKSDEFRKIIHNNRTGSTVPHLTQNMLINFPIPVPPLAEQERIVKILDQKFAQIDALKQNAETNLNNAKALFQSELEKAFSNTEWENMRLGDLCEIITGPFGSSIHKSDYVENGIPMINPQNIINNRMIPLAKCLVSNEAAMRLTKYKLKNQDIVIARRGEMGRCAVVTEAEIDWLCGTGSFIIRPNSKKTVSVYLQRYLSSAKTKKELEKQSIGATMSNLNQGILSAIEIPLPPLEEQKRIVAHLDSLSEKVHQLEEIYTKQLVACDELKQSFLQKAFAGEL